MPPISLKAQDGMMANLLITKVNGDGASFAGKFSLT